MRRRYPSSAPLARNPGGRGAPDRGRRARGRAGRRQAAAQRQRRRGLQETGRRQEAAGKLEIRSAARRSRGRRRAARCGLIPGANIGRVNAGRQEVAKADRVPAGLQFTVELASLCVCVGARDRGGAKKESPRANS